jgi:hypothetical protein
MRKIQVGFVEEIWGTAEVVGDQELLIEGPHADLLRTTMQDVQDHVPEKQGEALLDYALEHLQDRVWAVAMTL